MAEQVQCAEEQKEEILQYQKQQKLKKYTKFQCFWELGLIKVKEKIGHCGEKINRKFM